MPSQDNRGFLYPVKEKKSDKSPNMTGKILITPDMAGHEIEIAGWTQVSKAGHKYISLSVSEPYVKPAEQSPGNAPAYQAPVQANDGFDDDLPF